MANKRRPQGDGTIRKRSDGRWEARIIIGHKNDGSPMYKSAFAKTQKSARRRSFAENYPSLIVIVSITGWFEYAIKPLPSIGSAASQIASTISMPSVTRPNAAYLPSRLV